MIRRAMIAVITALYFMCGAYLYDHRKDDYQKMWSFLGLSYGVTIGLLIVGRE